MICSIRRLPSYALGFKQEPCPLFLRIKLKSHFESETESGFLVRCRRRYHTRSYVSRLFQNLGKVQPAESELTCKSHKLMIYNEVIEQCHSGVYHILPLGMRALEKLNRLIDYELQSIGAQKMTMPSLAPAHLWRKTDRWQTTGPELFKLKDRHEQQYCLGPTHEELITDFVARNSPIPYRKLPIMLYQTTRKFRDEKNPRYGLLRGREFDMKDLYTFDASEEKAQNTFEKVCQVYNRIFDRLHVDYVRVVGATGNIGGTFSHEYHIPAPVGEDTVLVCDSCGNGLNKEVCDGERIFDGCLPENCSRCFKEHNAIEVGHAFLLGQKYSSVFDAAFMESNGKPKVLEMGCYGLGVTRILQACLEFFSLENRMRWPEIIAPYKICIIPQKEGYMSEKFMEHSEELYDRLSVMDGLKGEIVIDDRTHLTVGKRLYEANRIGYPYIIVINKQVLESPSKFEVIKLTKSEEEISHMSSDQLSSMFSNIVTL